MVADQPACHVAAVGPTGDSDPVFVHDPFGLQRFQARHHIAIGAGTRIVENRMLIGIPEIVAAAVVGRKDQVSASGQQLGERREAGRRSRLRPSVYQQHQRQLLARLVTGRIYQNAILAEAVRSRPLKRLDLTKFERRDFVIEVRQASNRRAWTRRIVKLRRMVRFAAREGQTAIPACVDINPIRPSWVYGPQIEPLRPTVQPYQPQRYPSSIMSSREHRIAVRHPEALKEAPIQGLREICPRTARHGGDKQVIHIERVAVPVAPISDLGSVG